MCIFGLFSWKLSGITENCGILQYFRSARILKIPEICSDSNLSYRFQIVSDFDKISTDEKSAFSAFDPFFSRQNPIQFDKVTQISSQDLFKTRKNALNQNISGNLIPNSVRTVAYKMRTTPQLSNGSTLAF